MAEAMKESKKEGINKIFPTKNFFKRIGRMLGLPFHYTPTPGYDIREIPTYDDLANEINFKAIAQLNELMVKTEGRWDGAKGTEFENLNAAAVRDAIVKVYTSMGEDEKGTLPKESKDQVVASIGPFTDRAALYSEGKSASEGSGIKKEEITILGENMEFSIPQEKLIVHDPKRSYKVAFFGCRSITYWEKLNEEIDEICRKVIQKKLNLERDDAKKKNIEANVDLINGQIKSFLGIIKEYAKDFEDKHRSMLTGRRGVIKNWNGIKKLTSMLRKFNLTDEEVYYTHTYKVIRSKIPQTKKNEILAEDEGDKEIKIIVDEPVYDNGGNLTYEELKENKNYWVRPGEQGIGLDENGFPLEVGSGDTKFNGKVVEKGVVLIDLFEGRKDIRRVPEEFIVDCDLLEMAQWIYVAFDSYRDDMRDGRYHKNALTVMERIITELKIPDLKHPQSKRDIKKGRHAEVTMNLNSLPGQPKRSIKMGITPSHLNPAFDPRAFAVNPTTGKTIHRGRKYYYDLQENIFREQSEEPTITTRGAAMYILHRVIEEAKYWGGTGDPSRAGVIELLDAIGDQTKGFDIGPNLDRWGQPLTKNPFKPV